MENVTETRWLVLASDGRHVSLGRHSDPAPKEITRSEDALKAQGLGGWLVLMKGGYYDGRKKPGLIMVRQLGEPAASWEAAATAFEDIRFAAVRSACAGRKADASAMRAAVGSDKKPG